MVLFFVVVVSQLREQKFRRQNLSSEIAIRFIHEILRTFFFQENSNVAHVHYCRHNYPTIHINHFEFDRFKVSSQATFEEEEEKDRRTQITRAL